MHFGSPARNRLLHPRRVMGPGENSNRLPLLTKMPENRPANETRRAGDQDPHVFAGSLAISCRTSATSGAMVLRLNSNLQPAAANSSGNGREPPSDSDRL